MVDEDLVALFRIVNKRAKRGIDQKTTNPQTRQLPETRGGAAAIRVGYGPTKNKKRSPVRVRAKQRSRQARQRCQEEEARGRKFRGRTSESQEEEASQCQQSQFCPARRAISSEESQQRKSALAKSTLFIFKGSTFLFEGKTSS